MAIDRTKHPFHGSTGDAFVSAHAEHCFTIDTYFYVSDRLGIGALAAGVLVVVNDFHIVPGGSQRFNKGG